MNGKDKYEAIIEQAEKAKDADEKLDCVITLWKLFLTNDLPHIYDEVQQINAKFKKLKWLGLAIVLSILLSDQLSITAIIGFIAKIF